MLILEKEKELKVLAENIRIETIRAIESLGVGHIGGALSLAECLAVLYGEIMKIDPENPQAEDRD